MKCVNIVMVIYALFKESVSFSSKAEFPNLSRNSMAIIEGVFDEYEMTLLYSSQVKMELIYKTEEGFMYILKKIPFGTKLFATELHVIRLDDFMSHRLDTDNTSNDYIRDFWTHKHLVIFQFQKSKHTFIYDCITFTKRQIDHERTILKIFYGEDNLDYAMIIEEKFKVVSSIYQDSYLLDLYRLSSKQIIRDVEECIRGPKNGGSSVPPIYNQISIIIAANFCFWMLVPTANVLFVRPPICLGLLTISISGFVRYEASLSQEKQQKTLKFYTPSDDLIMAHFPDDVLIAELVSIQRNKNDLFVSIIESVSANDRRGTIWYANTLSFSFTRILIDSDLIEYFVC
ncbi:hypothetical protein RF11_11272 [Thelohanellus kitauei]|uniref:Uncharacterized protein n=1 Tax=Thelohanellus kitauei TaxID=669202 RepID=A0A0C2IWE3_THEKT|nr:hypothetical protein RF11_11272 [Thelohanellus kitauei]